MSTLYDELEVSASASPQIIRAAYRALMQAYHPDRHAGSDEFRAKAQRLNSAYDILSNPQKRAAYDATLARNAHVKREAKDNKTATHGAAPRDASVDEAAHSAESTAAKNSSGAFSEEPRRRGGTRQHATANERTSNRFNTRTGSNAPHPWTRFAARFVDLATSGFIVLLIAVVAVDLLPLNSQRIRAALNDDYVAIIVVLLLWVPIEALLLALTGYTPAKLLFGVSVRTSTGRNLSWGQALKRSCLVLVNGMFFGIPFASMLAQYFSFRHLMQTGTTSWDVATGCVVTQTPLGRGRALVCWLALVAASMFVIVTAMLGR